MKRILAILITITMLFLLNSCMLTPPIDAGSGDSDDDTNSSSNSSDGIIDKILENSSTNQEKNRKLLTKSVVRTNGVSYCDGKTDIYRIYEYIYDEEGNLKEENTYLDYSPITGRTELIEKKEYYSTSDPNVIKYGRIFYSYSAYENAYYKDETQTCYDVYNDDGVKLYTTNRDPILLKSMIVNEDDQCWPKENWVWEENDAHLKFLNTLFSGFDTMRQKITNYSDGTEAVEKTLYKNDEMIGFFRYVSDDSEDTEYHIYENGNIVKTYYDDNEHDVYLKYTYRYDADGNCTERKQYVDVNATKGDVGVPDSNGLVKLVKGGSGISVNGIDPFYRDSYGNTEWIGPSIYENVDYDIYTDVYTNTYVKLSDYDPPSPTASSSGGAIKSGPSASAGSSSGSIVCLHCKQSGYMECLFCDGTGKVLHGFKDNGEKMYSTCTYCSGGGARKCAYCGGDGYFRN